MLSEPEFVSNLCIHCILCNGSTFNAKSFCYKKYKDNPKKFTKICFSRLRKLTSWPYENFLGEELLFKNIFCNKSCKNKKKYKCHKNNIQFNKCLDEFEDQLNDTDFYNTYGKQLEEKVFVNKKPSVTFMCVGSKNWKELCGSLNAD